MQSPFVEPALGLVGRGARTGELYQESYALRTLAPPKGWISQRPPWAARTRKTDLPFLVDYGFFF